MALSFSNWNWCIWRFSKAPPAFERFAKTELAQWTLVFVLLYQGGAGQDIKFALAATLAMYALHHIFLNQ